MTTGASSTVTGSTFFLARRQIFLKEGVKDTTTRLAGKTTLKK